MIARVGQPECLHDLRACATAHASIAAVYVFPLLNATYEPSGDVFPGFLFECVYCGHRASPRQFLWEHDRAMAQEVVNGAHQRAFDLGSAECALSILQDLAMDQIDKIVAEILRAHAVAEAVL